MRRNRRTSLKKERIIMIASSAFVLTALTVTGVYMGQKEKENTDDGYTIDFTAMEENVDDKLDEIAQNQPKYSSQTDSQNHQQNNVGSRFDTSGDALDYFPADFNEEPNSEQVGSGEVEIPGLTGDALANAEEGNDQDAAVSAGEAVVAQELHFAAENGILRPADGEILLPYSMDASIYFPTLDQYKYHPAVVYSVAEGTLVDACAAGKVADIYQDAKLGTVVVLELGDGYEATYGQLGNLQVEVGDYLEAGECIGEIAAPTKYYSLEGSNLYFMVSNNGESLNPEDLMQE